MAKWIFDGKDMTEVHIFDAKDEIGLPLGIGRTEEWRIIPKDAMYEGM